MQQEQTSQEHLNLKSHISLEEVKLMKKFVAILTALMFALSLGFAAASTAATVTTLYDVSGTVTHGNPAKALSGVTVYLQYLESNGTWSTKAQLTTGTNGTYDFGRKWIAGTYRITAYKLDVSISPADRSVKLGPDAIGQSFTGTP